MFALENEQREVRYALLPADRFVTAAKVDEAAIGAYYAKHGADFMTTETARVRSRSCASTRWPRGCR